MEEALISQWAAIPAAESQQQDITKAGQLLQVVDEKKFPHFSLALGYSLWNDTDTTSSPTESLIK